MMPDPGQGPPRAFASCGDHGPRRTLPSRWRMGRQARIDGSPMCRHALRAAAPRDSTGHVLGARGRAGTEPEPLRRLASKDSLGLAAPAARRRLTSQVSADAGAPSRTLVIGAFAAMAVLGMAALSAVLAVVAARGTCSAAAAAAAPSATPRSGIPSAYLTLYRQAGRQYAVPWPVLVAVGSLESNHGRSRAPGVRAGVNRHGCCAGPMQFNLRDGPPSTWQRYRVDGDHDGAKDVYDPPRRHPLGRQLAAHPLGPGRRQPPGGDPRLQPLRVVRHRRPRARPRLRARDRCRARLGGGRLAGAHRLRRPPGRTGRTRQPARARRGRCDHDGVQACTTQALAAPQHLNARP
jgi:hypothetical protein